MANRPKNQHFVPRFYLRNFATPETRTRRKDKSQIWMFSNDETDGDERLTNIRNVCTRRYLYSPTDSAGQRDWVLEEKLAGLETQLASLWPSLAAKPVDFGHTDIRRMVALFVSVMHLRGPDNRPKIRNSQSLQPHVALCFRPTTNPQWKDPSPVA
jgi:hypothetical protein